MRRNDEPALPASDESVRRDPRAAADKVPQMFDAHLAHLFDYCQALLGREDDAAGITRSVLNSADALLHDPDRLRAWLFGLARRHALGFGAPAGHEPSYAPSAPGGDADDRDPVRAAAIRSAYRSLTDRDREILDLVHRHGIRIPDLEAVLGIPADEALQRLADAEAAFLGVGAGAPTGAAGPATRAGLRDLAGLPLAAMPAADPLPPAQLPGADRHGWLHRGFDGAAVWRTFARRRVQVTAVAVIPVAALAWAGVYLAEPAHTSVSPRVPVLRTNRQSPARHFASAPSPSPSRRAKAEPITGLVPVASRSALPPPRPTLSPSSTPQPSPSAVPSSTPPPSPSITISPSPSSPG